MKILSAEYILPIAEMPIKNGAVAIEKDKIIAVGKKQILIEKFPQAKIEDFGKSVILPGFVNCHSHLEITIMRGFLDEFDEDFSAWLIKLTKTRAEKLADEDLETSAMLGAFEGVRAGVTCFGDIGRLGIAGLNALKKNGLRGISFQETEFSPDNRTAVADFAGLKEKFWNLHSQKTDLVKAGISPHAPYTVSQNLFELITEFATSNDIKTTIHAAESLAEKKLMQNGQGFFAEFYKKQNVSWQTPKCSTIEYLSKIGVLATQPLLAHCVWISESDIELIGKSGSGIAHCPKSNAKFGHGIAPLESFLDRDITVGFGSDSMASNNNCDILEEARFATLLARTREKKKHFLTPQQIIETATIGGARALGLDNEIGTLEADKQADIIIITLETVAQMPVHNIYAALLYASNSGNLRMTMVAGEELYRDGVSKKIDESELKTKIEDVAGKMI